MTLQAQIDAFPTVEELAAMNSEEQMEVYDALQTAYDAYEELSEEEQAKITGVEVFESLFGWFNEQVSPLSITQNSPKTVQIKNDEGISITYWIIWSKSNEYIARVYGINCETPNTTVKIPETVEYDGDTFTVTQISLDSTSYSSNKNANVVGLEIPESVEIYNISCPDMETFTVPARAKSISFGANNNQMTNLKEIIFEDGMEEIKNANLFRYCPALTTVKFPDTLKKFSATYALAHSPSTLKMVTLPDSLESLADGMFMGSTGLESITLPASITDISWWAFNGCTSLKTVEAESPITSIGAKAFYNCTALQTVPSLADVTTMGEAAFQNCYNLTSENNTLDLSSLKVIPNYAFNNVSRENYAMEGYITGVKFSDELESIGNYAFAGDWLLWKGLDFPPTLKSIGNYAFQNIAYMYEKSNAIVNIPDSVTSIGSYAFQGANVKEVYIGSGVETISTGTFAYNTIDNLAGSLEKITFDNYKEAVTIASGAIPDGIEVVWLEESIGDVDDKISNEDNAKTLQEAVNDAAEGETITISKNIRLNETLNIPSEKNITICSDENGPYTIIGKEDSVSPLSTLITVEEGAKITFQDVILSGHSNTGSVIYDQGSLILDRGAIVTKANITSGTNGAITVTGSNASFTMKDGSIVEKNKIATTPVGTILITNGANAVIEGGTIQNNMVTLTDTYVASSGIMVYQDGNCEMSGGTITGNSAIRGSAVMLYSLNDTKQATFTLSGSALITENSCASPSSIDAAGAVDVEGNSKFVMTGGTISNNTGGAGAGVCVLDNKLLSSGSQEYGTTFLMQGGTISGNTARSSGGGIYTFSNGTLLTAGSITGNSANMGGGIYCEGNTTRYSTLHMKDAMITANESGDQGGGLYLCSTGDAKVHVTDGGAIIGNTAAGAGDDVVSIATHKDVSVSITLEERMLGGGKVSYYQDGVVYVLTTIGLQTLWGTTDSATRYPDTSSEPVAVVNNQENLALKAVAETEAISLANETATLMITGNRADLRGGGVASNGGVVIAASEETIPDEYTLEVIKEWSADTPESKKTAVTVYLKIGDHQLDSVELNEDNNWTAKFTGLPDPDTLGDKKISVVESPVPANFTPTYQDAVIDKENKTIQITISNQYKKDTPGGGDSSDTYITVTAKKEWKLDDGGKKTASVTAVLYRNGERYDSAELNEANGWTHKWNNLNDKYTWTVKEETVPEGFTSSVEKNGNTFTILNDDNPDDGDTYKTVTAKKEWKLDDGGEKAASVTAVLYRDGEKYDTAVLNENNGWTHTWTGLNEKYAWTVKEESVPDGFTSSVKQDGNTFTITNDDNPKDTPDNPDKPNTPDTPDKPDKPLDDVPQTGDNRHIGLWIGLACLSLFGMLAALIGRKRLYRHWK